MPISITPGAALGDNALTTAFYGSYGQKDRYNIGAETFWQSTRNALKIGSASPFDIANKYTFGISTWAWYQFHPKVGVVGRFDYFDPSTNSATVGDSRNLYILSLFYRPYKSVYIMPNVEVETYQAGNFALAFTESAGENRLLPALVDPVAVFGTDTSFTRPEAFLSQPLADLLAARQATCGRTPCGLFAHWLTRAPAPNSLSG